MEIVQEMAKTDGPKHTKFAYLKWHCVMHDTDDEHRVKI